MNKVLLFILYVVQMTHGSVPGHGPGVGDCCFRVLVRARWVPLLPSLQAAVHLPFFIPACILHVFTCLIFHGELQRGREGIFRDDALKANQPTWCHLSPPTIKKFSGREYFRAVFLHEKIWLFSHHINSFLLVLVVLLRKGLELFLITTNFNATD